MLLEVCIPCTVLRGTRGPHISRSDNGARQLVLEGRSYSGASAPSFGRGVTLRTFRSLE